MIDRSLRIAGVLAVTLVLALASTVRAEPRVSAGFSGSDFSVNYQWSANGQAVTGLARNDSGRRLRYLELDFNVLNGGAVIGSCLANVLEVQPGQVWQFLAHCGRVPLGSAAELTAIQAAEARP